MNKINSLAATLGVSLLGALALNAQAAVNPFAAQELQSGYSLAEKGAEGSCGAKDEEGKCGSKTDEGSCGAKTGGEAKSDAEGKCGEGKCGAAE
jgi:uncharacterized low-complexity protein